MSKEKVINYTELRKEVATETGESFTKVQKILDTYQEKIKEHLEAGYKVRLKLLGTLYKSQPYQRFFNPMGKSKAGIYTVGARYKLKSARITKK